MPIWVLFLVLAVITGSDLLQALFFLSTLAVLILSFRIIKHHQDKYGHAAIIIGVFVLSIELTTLFAFLYYRASNNAFRELGRWGAMTTFVLMCLSFLIYPFLMKNDWVLQKLGFHTVSRLIRDLQKGTSNERATAALRLGEAGDQRAIGPLNRAIEDSDITVRENAASALHHLLGDTAVPFLLRARGSTDQVFRQASIHVLDELEVPVDLLLHYVVTDRDPIVRNNAMDVLTERGSASIAPLLDILGNGDFPQRAAAAFILGEIGQRTSVPALIAALGSTNPEVRFQTAVALGRLGDEAAVSPLIALLEDSNTDVCAAAVEALGTLKNSRALPTLRRMQQKWAAQGTEGQFLADTARQAIWQIEGHV